MALRELTRDVVRSFRANGLPNFASAMAFRVVLALVPFQADRRHGQPGAEPEAGLVAHRRPRADAVGALRGDPRHTMAALDCVFGYGRRRGLVELLPRLLALGAAMGVCVVSAIAIVRFGPLLTGDLDGILAVLSFLGCWLLAAAVLGLGLTSIAFGLYATYVASYTSVFGHLASIFVLLLYLWLSGDAFLAGIQLDACVRERS